MCESDESDETIFPPAANAEPQTSIRIELTPEAVERLNQIRRWHEDSRHTKVTLPPSGLPAPVAAPAEADPVWAEVRPWVGSRCPGLDRVLKEKMDNALAATRARLAEAEAERDRERDAWAKADARNTALAEALSWALGYLNTEVSMSGLKRGQNAAVDGLLDWLGRADAVLKGSPVSDAAKMRQRCADYVRGRFMEDVIADAILQLPLEECEHQYAAPASAILGDGGYVECAKCGDLKAAPQPTTEGR